MGQALFEMLALQRVMKKTHVTHTHTKDSMNLKFCLHQNKQIFIPFSLKFWTSWVLIMNTQSNTVVLPSSLLTRIHTLAWDNSWAHQGKQLGLRSHDCERRSSDLSCPWLQKATLSVTAIQLGSFPLVPSWGSHFAFSKHWKALPCFFFLFSGHLYW